jgi:hypothetical protein
MSIMSILMGIGIAVCGLLQWGFMRGVKRRLAELENVVDRDRATLQKQISTLGSRQMAHGQVIDAIARTASAAEKSAENALIIAGDALDIAKAASTLGSEAFERAWLPPKAPAAAPVPALLVAPAPGPVPAGARETMRPQLLPEAEDGADSSRTLPGVGIQELKGRGSPSAPQPAAGRRLGAPLAVGSNGRVLPPRPKPPNDDGATTTFMERLPRPCEPPPALVAEARRPHRLFVELQPPTRRGAELGKLELAEESVDEALDGRATDMDGESLSGLVAPGVTSERLSARGAESEG